MMNTRLFLIASLKALLFCAVSTAAETAKLPADKIFPDAVKGFVSVKNLKELTDLWTKTEAGQLFNDPLMDAFKKAMREQFATRLEKTFGLSLDAVTGLPSGEVAFGMLAVPNEVPGNVLTMDVTDRRQKVDEYLGSFTQKLVNIGVKQSSETYKGRVISILQFPPPKENDAPESEKNTRKDKTENKAVRSPVRFVYYMFQGDILIVSDQRYLIKLIADRLSSEPQAAALKSLADVAEYQYVMKRLRNDIPGGEEPPIRWYVEPLNYGEAMRTLAVRNDPNRKEKPSIFSLLKEQGFDAVKGIGGTVHLKSEGKESVYRTFAYAPKPYRLAMKIFDLPNHQNFAAPPWMPADTARCTFVNVDPLVIFDNFGSLFDTVIMQGEKGVWKDIIKGLEEDPLGPKINLRDELIAHLGTRALGMSHYDKPITGKSESIVVAVELKEGKETAVKTAFEKLFGTDPEMQGTPHKNYKLWHRIPAEEVIEPIDIEVPGLVDTAPTTAKKPLKNEEDNVPPVFPDGAAVIAKNCLFVSTNIDYLKKILDRLDNETESAVSTQEEYQEVDKVFAGMGLADKPHFLQVFIRTHETFRPTYELVRKNQMVHANTVLAKILNLLFTPPDEENAVRKQAIDGSTLPEFDKIEKYFGTAGLYGMSEDDGFFIKGFLLPRKK